MIRHVDQLLAFDDEAFVSALYASCFARQPNAGELSYFVGELRRGRGKVSVLFEFANFDGSANWRAALPGLEELLVVQHETSHGGRMEMPENAFTSAELSALSPVAGQILREITQAVANAADEANF